jgi:redox-sensitive bicupin YhaK (pirin superfamily)
VPASFTLSFRPKTSSSRVACSTWNKPTYQDIEADTVSMLASDDAGAVVRLIAGDIAEFEGPGSTFTPITYAHATLAAGARLRVPWRTDFNALVYILNGRGTAGPDARPLIEGQMAVFGAGDHVEIAAGERQDNRSPEMDVLLLGGLPIREQIAWHGPFVMNTKQEIIQAIEDYHAGKMGAIPAEHAGIAGRG